MTATRNGANQPPDGADRVAVDLAELRKHTVELLARLERPPRNLRIRAGEVSVDITWTDQPAAPGPEPVTEARATDARRAAAPAVEVCDDEAAREYLTSPGVGVFHHAREPGAEPFVSVGSLVRPGQQVGILEAMKLMIPVEADRGGRIVDVLKGSGESVEYAEPLFALDIEEA